MEKRLLLAIGLSLVVLLSWSAFNSKTQPVANKQVTIVTPASTESNQSPVTIVSQAALPENPAPPLLQFVHNNTEIFFDEQHAAINKVIFKGIRTSHLLPLKFGLLSDDGTLKFVKTSSGPQEITFVGQDALRKVTKSFLFSKSNNTIQLQIKIQNISHAPLTINWPLILGRLDFSGHNEQARYQDIYLVNSEKSLHLAASKDYQGAKTKVLGLRDRYFCLIVEPDTSSYNGFIKKLNNTESEVGFNTENIILQPGAQIGHLFKIYLGPQDVKAINQINPAWAGIIYFGTFDIIAQVLLQSLDFLHKILHSWGWAIIALSVLVYLILYPLSLKQMRSMKDMQAIQPKVEELRKQYKDNPQKMNKEIMELYRMHKVNPFGGCLPLILQMPIFFALYNALMRSVALKGATFLWIKDLSEPDKLFTLPVSLPVISNEFNLLPIIMAIGMFFQQKISSAAASGASAEQQKIMLIVMPVMFGFIFYRMPSGLVLYWLVNSMLMLGFQLQMNRAK
ncbi:MAG: membrane protein insertase YidC [Candidatus Omnitrophota bacterium]|jgi:YidC/Oxa1 family membrane protein insertase